MINDYKRNRCSITKFSLFQNSVELSGLGCVQEIKTYRRQWPVYLPVSPSSHIHEYVSSSQTDTVAKPVHFPEFTMRWPPRAFSDKLFNSDRIGRKTNEAS